MATSDAARQIRLLEDAGRLAEAAELAAASGQAARASDLFERACMFDRAARAAADAGDAQRAVALAVLSGSEEAIGRAVDVATSGEPGRARGAAAAASARGHGHIAGTILERIGDHREAAEAYALAGRAVQAAACYLRVDDARGAARVLEAALRTEPNNEEVALRLGALLVRHGRHDAAMRVLQRIGESSSRRAEALPLLVSCADALGLAGPSQSLRDEAARVGASTEVPRASASESPGVSVVYGRYEIVRPVASTHTARVFEARDRLTGSRVAVKQLVAANVLGGGRDAFERLVREARILEQLRHPNVVPLVELLSENAAMVTPWMSGGSLADLLSRGPVVPARAVEITAAVLAALGEAHALGILHRDVKPSNILFDDAGVPRLADFGAAHISDTSVTATAGVIGTLAYMSPEQRLGLPATTASDLYSAGATLYEMLVGVAPPITGAPVRKPSEVNPDLGPEHDSVALALLGPQPSDRPADAWAARSALTGVPWPAEASRGRALQQETATIANAGGARLVARGGLLWQDTWLAREVLLVPATPAMLAAARKLASVSCDALPSVLRVDSEASRIWFERPGGQTLRAAGRKLNGSERAAILEALRALHACGLIHGALDADHVLVQPDGARLELEPDGMLGVDARGDLEALERIA